MEKEDLDIEGIASYFIDKKVLITGAAGSIGSELAERIANLNPKKLVLIDNNESSLHELDLDLKDKANLYSIIADIKDTEKIKKIFSEEKPEIVYHAAAYKHIPLMELFPEEAVKNNIKGTLNILHSCLENNAERFVLISSDKAVNPSNIMGATKRICELLVKILGKKGYISVRFGNVKKSRGSVIPIFEKQINENKDITVTHPEMERYFMETKEACNLILESTLLAEDGEIFVLDMGKPIKIIDIAKEMINASGKDLEIKFIGPRPGEKIKEQLFLEGEEKTKHKKIFVAKNHESLDKEKIIKDIDELFVLADKLKRQAIKEKIKEILPNFQGIL